MISVKARAGKDGYFVSITSFLHPVPELRRAVLHIGVVSCIHSHLSSLVYFTSPLVGFCFVGFCFVVFGFFSPELVNIHKCACKV